MKAYLYVKERKFILGMILFLAILLMGGCDKKDDDFFEEPDFTPPYVTSTIPYDQEMGVAVDLVLQVEFDEDIDFGSIVQFNNGNCGFNQTVQISDDGLMTCLGANVDMLTNAWTMDITPHSPLAYGRHYDVKVTSNVADMFGNPMGWDYSFNFVTGQADLTGYWTSYCMYNGVDYIHHELNFAWDGSYTNHLRVYGGDSTCSVLVYEELDTGGWGLGTDGWSDWEGSYYKELDLNNGNYTVTVWDTGLVSVWNAGWHCDTNTWSAGVPQSIVNTTCDPYDFSRNLFSIYKSDGFMMQWGDWYGSIDGSGRLMNYDWVTFQR